MDPEQVLTQISETATSLNDGIKSFAEIGGKFETQLAEFNETAKKILVKPEDIKTAAELEAENKAKLEQGAVGAITRFEVWDIPVGQAVIGGFAAVFASELIDGFLVRQADWMKGLIKLAGAGAAIKWGPRAFGKTGAYAVGLLLAYDGIRSLIPIDSWARRGATAVTSRVPGGGLGGFKKDVGVLEQAGKVASDYYSRAEGR